MIAHERPGAGFKRPFTVVESNSSSPEQFVYESGANVQRTIPLSLDMMDELISKQAAQLRDNETQHENAQRHLRQANAAQQHACQEVEFLQQRNEDMAQKIATNNSKIDQLYKTGHELYTFGNDAAALASKLEQEVRTLRRLHEQLRKPSVEGQSQPLQPQQQQSQPQQQQSQPQQSQHSQQPQPPQPPQIPSTEPPRHSLMPPPPIPRHSIPWPPQSTLLQTQIPPPLQPVQQPARRRRQNHDTDFEAAAP